MKNTQVSQAVQKLTLHNIRTDDRILWLWWNATDIEHLTEDLTEEQIRSVWRKVWNETSVHEALSHAETIVEDAIEEAVEKHRRFFDE
jgi:hypothetical protein